MKIHYEKQIIEKHIKDVSVVSLKLMFTAVIKSRSSTQIYINEKKKIDYLEMEGENSGNTREEKGGAGTNKKAHNREDT